MADSREVRTSAFEVKFVIGEAVAARVRAWARAHLDPDPHGAGPHGDEYRTSSLYLDTAARDVYHRRGSYGRSKYRVRRYGESETVFLERKLREPGVLAKRRTLAPLRALETLGATPSGAGWCGQWFEQRLIARRLRPVCQVSYERTARLGRDAHAIRLTLDRTLTARPAAGLTFTVADGAPVLHGHAILELKFRGDVPVLFRRLVEEFALVPGRASKYRLGMAAIDPSLAAAPVHV